MQIINSLLNGVMKRFYLVAFLLTAFLFFDYHQKVSVSYDAEQRVNDTLICKGYQGSKTLAASVYGIVSSVLGCGENSDEDSDSIAPVPSQTESEEPVGNVNSSIELPKGFYGIPENIEITPQSIEGDIEITQEY